MDHRLETDAIPEAAKPVRSTFHYTTNRAYNSTGFTLFVALAMRFAWSHLSR